jgi:hypothetical protein
VRQSVVQQRNSNSIINFIKEKSHQKNEKTRTERAALADTALLGVNVRLQLRILNEEAGNAAHSGAMFLQVLPEIFKHCNASTSFQ